MMRLTEPRYIIHPVQNGDLREVMRLAWRTTDRLWPYAFFERIAATQRDYFRVVSHAETGHVLGFLIAAQQPGTTDRILLLAVDPTLQGRGIRRALLADIQELLRDEGERSFTVEVQGADQETIQFYRKQQFEVVGFEAGSVPGEERILLSKDLTTSQRLYGEAA